MAVDSKKFRTGFMRAVAENGLLPEDVGNYALHKHAEGGGSLVNYDIEAGLGQLPVSIAKALSIPVDVATAGLIGATGLGGLGLGTVGYKLTKGLRGDQEETASDIKNNILTEELKFQTELLNRRTGNQ